MIPSSVNSNNTACPLFNFTMKKFRNKDNINTPWHSAQFFIWMWQLYLSKIAKSKDPMFGLSPLAILMYFESLIPNLSLVFARMPHFAKKCSFWKLESKFLFLSIFINFNFTNFLPKIICNQEQKIQKKLSNWNWQLSSNCRFRFSGQNYID